MDKPFDLKAHLTWLRLSSSSSLLPSFSVNSQAIIVYSTNASLMSAEMAFSQYLQLSHLIEAKNLCISNSKLHYNTLLITRNESRNHF